MFCGNVGDSATGWWLLLLLLLVMLILELSVVSLKPSLRASSLFFVADDPGSSCMTLTDKWWKKNKSSWRTCIHAGMM